LVNGKVRHMENRKGRTRSRLEGNRVITDGPSKGRGEHQQVSNHKRGNRERVGSEKGKHCTLVSTKKKRSQPKTWEGGGTIKVLGWEGGKNQSAFWGEKVGWSQENRGKFIVREGVVQ